MIVGPLSAIVAKWAGLGALAKTATATATAATTLVVGGVAGVIPGSAAPVDTERRTNAAVTVSVVNPTPTSPPSVPTPFPTRSEISVETESAADSNRARPRPTTPTPSPASQIPDLAGLPTDVPKCVTDLVKAHAGVDHSQLANKIPDCIESVLASRPEIPAEITDCVRAVLSLTASAGGATISPEVAARELGACSPVDTSACMTSALALARTAAEAGPAGAAFGGRGFPVRAGASGRPGPASIPDVSALVGNCVPFDLGACLTSALGVLPTSSTTGIGRPDLSSCLPSGVIPGLPGGIPGLPFPVGGR
ncbi:MAG: hypothetical protein ACT4OS_05515 [Acidimicrobiales bacterium]